MRPLPQGDWFFYTGPGQNKAVRLGSGEPTYIGLPGVIDGVPTPDGRFLTFPQITGQTASPLRFFNAQSLLSQARPGTEVNTVSTARSLNHEARIDGLDGVYQSIGQLSGQREGEELRYRAITEDQLGTWDGSSTTDSGSSLWTQEYIASGVNTPAEAVTAVGRAHRLCGNLANILKTPMISRTGRELAAFDIRSRTTRIFSIDNEGNCTQTLDLGIATGKVDFSPDGSQITFHADVYVTNPEFEGTVGSDKSKNVFVAKLKRENGRVQMQEIARVTAHSKKGDGAYYPTFRNDGTIAFLMKEQSIENADQQIYSIRTVDAGSLAFRSVTLLGRDPCAPDAKSAAAVHALGALWQSICTQYREGIRAQDAAFFALNLDPAACLELVRQHWNDRKAELVSQGFEDLAEVDLQAACPKVAHRGSGSTGVAEVQPPPRPEEVPSVQKSPPASGLDVAKKCLACHPRKFDLERPSKPDFERALRAIEAGRMPPGGALSQQEKDAFKTYMESRLGGH